MHQTSILRFTENKKRKREVLELLDDSPAKVTPKKTEDLEVVPSSQTPPYDFVPSFVYSTITPTVKRKKAPPRSSGQRILSPEKLISLSQLPPTPPIMFVFDLISYFLIN